MLEHAQVDFVMSRIRTHTHPARFVSYTETPREVRSCECRTFTKGVPQLKQGLVYCVGPNHGHDFSEAGIRSLEYQLNLGCDSWSDFHGYGSMMEEGGRPLSEGTFTRDTSCPICQSLHKL